MIVIKLNNQGLFIFDNNQSLLFTIMPGSFLLSSAEISSALGKSKNYEELLTRYERQNFVKASYRNQQLQKLFKVRRSAIQSNFNERMADLNRQKYSAMKDYEKNSIPLESFRLKIKPTTQKDFRTVASKISSFAGQKILTEIGTFLHLSFLVLATNMSCYIKFFFQLPGLYLIFS